MYFEETSNIYTEINNYKSIIRDKEAEIEQIKLVTDSLTESMIMRIRSIVLPYSEKMLSEAWIQQDKPAAERKMFKFVTEDLLERLFDKDERKKVKFDKIIPFGYDRYVYGFQFTYKGIKFEVQIPNVKVTSKENVKHMWYGTYVLMYEKGKNVWDYIEDSYDLNYIAEAIKEFVGEV